MNTKIGPIHARLFTMMYSVLRAIITTVVKITGHMLTAAIFSKVRLPIFATITMAFPRSQTICCLAWLLSTILHARV